MSGERLGWGILGCGQFARRRVLPAFASSNNARVVALQRRDRDAARATAREFGVANGYASREELLADPLVRAVFVASHHAGHEADVLAAAAAGKQVLCEKPLALNADACKRMLAGCRVAGVRLFTGHCFRYSDAVTQTRRLLLSGDLGELRALRGYYSFLAPATAWRNDCRSSGGGPLLDLAPHILDFFRFVTGEEITAVQALVDPERDFTTGRCEASARALLKLRGGVVAMLEVSFSEHFRNGFEVVGSKSSLRGEYTLNQIASEHVRLFYLTSDPAPPRIVELPLEAGKCIGWKLKT